MLRVINTIAVMAITLSVVGCDMINEELPTYQATSIVECYDQAPDFTTTLLSGQSITLSELRGEIVLLIFFSHTCPDCKALLDDIKASTADLEELGVRILAIAREGTVHEIEEYVATNSYCFDTAIDNNREIYNLYATMYVPRCYLIDKEGIVAATTIEYQSDHVPTLLSQIETLK